jgi:hypothetical protein
MILESPEIAEALEKAQKAFPNFMDISSGYLLRLFHRFLLLFSQSPL